MRRLPRRATSDDVWKRREPVLDRETVDGIIGKPADEFRAIVARREQRLREWDEYVGRRRARLRRLTFGLLGREPQGTSG